jgi:FkbM family methyltransferase
MIRSAVRKVRDYLQNARLRALGPEPGWAEVEGGFEMFIDPKDDLDQEFYLGTFEPAMRELIAKVVQAGDTCLDIGAQKGYVSLTLARAAGDSGKVFSFEADSRAAEKFLANIGRSKKSSIHLMQYALGEKEGTCTFALSDVLGWSSRFPNEMAKNAVHKVVEVPMHSLDALMERKELDLNLDKLSFIKMDVEGSEPFVIKGMRKLLLTAKPILFLEVNYDSLTAAGSSAEELQGLLQDLDYNLYQTKIDRYFHRLSLEPVENLAALRPLHSHFTNAVAVPRTLVRPGNKITQLIAQRN